MGPIVWARYLLSSRPPKPVDISVVRVGMPERELQKVFGKRLQSNVVQDMPMEFASARANIRMTYRLERPVLFDAMGPAAYFDIGQDGTVHQLHFFTYGWSKEGFRKVLAALSERYGSPEGGEKITADGVWEEDWTWSLGSITRSFGAWEAGEDFLEVDYHERLRA